MDWPYLEAIDYPGREPSLNLDHPMARGGARLAAVAVQGGAFIDLVRGVSSVPTKGSISPDVSISTTIGYGIGQQVTAANGQWNSIANSYNDGTADSVSMAIIYSVPSVLGNGTVSNPFITFGNWNGNQGVGLSMTGTGSSTQFPGVYSNGGTQNFNTFEWNMVAGHSYFFAVEWRNSGMLIAAIRDLTPMSPTASASGTFINQTTTTLITTTQNSQAYGIGIGTAGGLNRSAGCNIAACAFSVNSLLSIQEMKAWGDDPWSYWYDPAVEQQPFNSLAFYPPVAKSIIKDVAVPRAATF